MEDLVQTHDLLNYGWNDDSYHHQQLFHEIDQWENESINKIHVTADMARADLRSFIKESTSHSQTSTKEISEEIDKSRQLKNFSEIDINRWTQQLDNIQRQIKKSFNIQVKEDKETSPITLIKIEQKTKRQLDRNEQRNKRLRNETTNDFRDETETNGNVNNERFDQVLQSSQLYEKNLVALNGIDSRSLISGANSYSYGRHSLHFRIEQVYKAGWSCFFGIITSNEHMKNDVSEMLSIYGIWSSGYNVKFGNKSGSSGARKWDKDDNVILTLDCDNKQLHIENKRINWRQIFDIDLHSCPFPWKFITIIKLCRLRIENDSSN